jgi:hypothetical protein
LTDCVLHIGLEKTGTTSLQATLANNRARLAEQGILYPVSLGERSHVKAYMFASQSGPDPMKAQFGLTGADDVEVFREMLADNLAREIENARPRLVCVSNEHCSSRLLALEEIERLKSLIERHCERTTIVVYLRAQGEMLRSSYSTYLKTGGTGPFGPPNPVEIAGKYDHEAILDRWAAVFGRQALDVRLFDPAHLVGSDVVTDFIGHLDPALAIDEFEISAPLNHSLGSVGAEFLREMNRLVPYLTEGALNPLRGNLHDLIANFADDIPFEGVQAVCDALDEDMSAANERVRRRYFPQIGAPVFKPATWPEASEGFDRDAARAKLIAHIWKAKQGQVLDLRAALLRAQRQKDATRG